MNPYFLVLNNQQAGPFAPEAVRQMIKDGRINGATLAFTKGMTAWTPLHAVPEFSADLYAANTPPPTPPASASAASASAAEPLSGVGMTPSSAAPTVGWAPGSAWTGGGAPPQSSTRPAANTPGAQGELITTRYGIHYQVMGHEMQFVEILLDSGQTVIAEAGSMMFMSQGIALDTQLGDGSSANQGFLGKVLEAGKRVMTGATLFLTTFTSSTGSRETVAFSAPYPGKIVPIDLTEMGGQIICEKHSFLCAARGTNINIEFTRRIGAGFFGGEGFILQRLSGNSMAFIHACGTVVEKNLRPGEYLRVDTGCLVAFQPSVQYDIQFVGNIKTAIFGGEGLFFVTLTGPGRVWLQSLPFSRLADRIIAASPRAGGSRQEAGSILGGLGDLISGEQ